MSFRPAEKFKKGGYHLKVINIPLTKLVKMDQVPVLNRESYGGVAFMSTEGVNAFMEFYGIPYLEGKKVFSIGIKTGNKLEDYGIESMIPSVQDSSGLSELICGQIKSGGSILVPRNREHNYDLEQRLESCGIGCINLILYYYMEMDPSMEIEKNLLENGFLGFVFTSPREVEIFHRITQGKYANARCFPIGKTTETTLIEMGYRNLPLTGKGDFEKFIENIDKNSGEWI